MTSRVPGYSPLFALAKKAALWIALPITLVVVFLAFANETPQQRSINRTIEDRARVNDADPGTKAARARAEEYRRQAGNRPEAEHGKVPP